MHIHEHTYGKFHSYCVQGRSLIICCAQLTLCRSNHGSFALIPWSGDFVAKFWTLIGWLGRLPQVSHSIVFLLCDTPTDSKFAASSARSQQRFTLVLPMINQLASVTMDMTYDMIDKGSNNTLPVYWHRCQHTPYIAFLTEKASFEHMDSKGSVQKGYS